LVALVNRLFFLFFLDYFQKGFFLFLQHVLFLVDFGLFFVKLSFHFFSLLPQLLFHLFRVFLLNHMLDDLPSLSSIVFGQLFSQDLDLLLKFSQQSIFRILVDSDIVFDVFGTVGILQC
jgi:hypothetical protein